MSNEDIVRLKTLVNQRDHVIGIDNAPVTVVEYGNFECIDCGRVYPVLKEIRKELGQNLRFVFRNFPTTRAHPHALRAAEAAESAAAQGKFWEMHDQLFQHQDALTDPHLKHYAAAAHLDVDRFEKDMEKHTFLGQIEEDYQVSLFDDHITGTPTIFLNGVIYTGAIDPESMLEAIKQADTEGKITILKEHHRLRDLIERIRAHRPRAQI
jgi:formate-nitrite transporter family protein